jgi:hypothetical protein
MSLKEQAIDASELRDVLSYDPKTGLFRWVDARNNRIKAGSIAGTVSRRGYVNIFVRRKNFQAHRLAWLYVCGEWPECQIDHINGDPGDNRFCNLRLATLQQNRMNTKTHRTNVVGLKGVRRSKKRWRASIRVNRHTINLGSFGCPTAAHLAYCKAAKAHFGEFARFE